MSQPCCAAMAVHARAARSILRCVDSVKRTALVRASCSSSEALGTRAARNLLRRESIDTGTRDGGDPKAPLLSSSTAFSATHEFRNLATGTRGGGGPSASSPPSSTATEVASKAGCSDAASARDRAAGWPESLLSAQCSASGVSSPALIAVGVAGSEMASNYGCHPCSKSLARDARIRYQRTIEGRRGGVSITDVVDANNCGG